MRFFQRLASSVRMQNAVQPVLAPRFAGPGAQIQAPGSDFPAGPEHATGIPEAPAPHAAGPAPTPAASDAAPATPSQTRFAASAPQIGPVATPAPGAPARADAPPAPAMVLVHETSIEPAPDPAAYPRPQQDQASAPHAPVRPPLSEQALAQRVQPTKGERTIVHVTIDRIDVRAPAPAQAPRAQAKPRPAPTTSLADYLRRGRS